MHATAGAFFPLPLLGVCCAHLSLARTLAEAQRPSCRSRPRGNESGPGGADARCVRNPVRSEPNAGVMAEPWPKEGVACCLGISGMKLHSVNSCDDTPATRSASGSRPARLPRPVSRKLPVGLAPLPPAGAGLPRAYRQTPGKYAISMPRKVRFAMPICAKGRGPDQRMP